MNKINKIKASKRFEKRVSVLLISLAWFGYIIGSIQELPEQLNKLANAVMFILNMSIVFRTGFLEEKLSKGWNNAISVVVSVSGLLAIVFCLDDEHQEIMLNLISAVGMSLTFWYICVQKTSKE